MLRFRWVSLHLQFLRSLKRADTVWKRLGELPNGLRDIYDDIYRVKIEGLEEQGSIAKNAFKLLLTLQTQLKHEEFLQALSFCGEDKIDVSAEDLIDFSCNFLVLDAELDVFRFAHLSVREYLDTRSEYGPEYSHALAAQFCLRYLCTSNTAGPFLIPRDPSPDGDATLRSDGRIMSWKIDPAQPKCHRKNPPDDDDDESCSPFLNRVQEYTCSYWAFHLAAARKFRFLHPLKDMLREFAADTSQEVSPWFMYWNRLAFHVIYSRRGHHCTPKWARIGDRKDIEVMVHYPADYLFAASALGACDLLEVRLRSKPDPLFLRCYLETYDALQLACRFGTRDAVEFLLDRGWGLQVDNHFSLLGLALDGPHFETVKLLLSRGVDPNESYYDYDVPYTPIFRAIEFGSLELVKILLDYGASADVENRRGLKPFHEAAIDGKQEIADLFLARSTDADKLPRSFCRQLFLLHKAVRNGDEDLLNTTLENWPQGAQGNKCLDYALWDVLERRVRYHKRLDVVNETCVKALLAKGADVNCSFGGRSLLFLISDWEIPELDENYKKRTRLSASDFSILQLLVDHGADLEGREFMLKSEVGLIETPIPSIIQAHAEGSHSFQIVDGQCCCLECLKGQKDVASYC